MSQTNANIVILTGILFICLGLSQFVTAFKSRHWVSTPGVITQSHVASNRSRIGPTSYYVDVQYVYAVESHHYYGDSLSLDDPESSDKHFAQQQLKDYPVHKMVDVFYQPSDPSNSTLQPSESPFSQLLTVIIGGVLILVGRKFRSASA